MFICKVCGSEVKNGQAFCPGCGADVVENYETVCPACGSKNGAGSRYCAKCGSILGILRKPVCAVCGSKNLPGARYCVACGAPIIASEETHSDEEVLNARKAKQQLDAMARERMAAIDREIADKRKRFDDEKQSALDEIEGFRLKTNEDLEKQARLLNAYRDKLNELGSEDLAQLKKASDALKKLAVYYSDPLSQLSEDQINGETFVCPACGTINPLTAEHCSHCGRSKARSILLLEKGKIKQRAPIRRKKDVVTAPELDLETAKTPTFDEFAGEEFEKLREKPEPEPVKEEKEKPADFSGPAGGGFYGYPYSPYAYPFAQPAMPASPTLAGEKSGEPYQMPPIVQPVAFVPYVTQEQPLMQYSPVIPEQDKK